MKNADRKLARLVLLLATAALWLAVDLPVAGQSRDSAQKPARVPWWKVSVSAADALAVTVQAEEAPLSRVAGDLAKQLGVPVKLSPLMQTQRVTAEFANEPMEAALRSLAPQAYTDYVLVGGGAAQPKCIGVFLHALNEAPPSPNASIKPRSEAILFTGNTEDVDSPDRQNSGAPPLLVSIEGGRLKVSARRQPLTAVLYEVAQKLGIAFEMRHESQELVDLELSGYRLEDVLRLLPQGVQLYQRVNLLSNEATPLRIILVKPRGD